MMFRNTIIIILLLISFHNYHLSAQTLNGIKLQNGDLLFVDLDCGPLCDAIEEVTISHGSNHFSHIGLVYLKVDTAFVIEAIGNRVQLTPMAIFADRTEHKICIGRLKPSKQYLITQAVKFATDKLGTKYDEAFLYDNDKYYCSELIYDAFKAANNKKPFFKLEPMTFKKPGSNEFYPVWIEYYQKLNINIPEGKPGINPGGISRSKKIVLLN
ncbi:YiiX/YebB-like N1pC/P60 family cysteine hydrolase [Solitalea lacus]|uniref:YiiX/YebB-like N1pC/P60 family cysteine hydrolase n=1 Tax=Solitalea lacus TaxID=2911172 RepID=UPI001EDC3918|nr:YiiX/YebB-like N1pC/P60 family cysteine hydrolase [Solitalea lacus]UKJ06005.1 hypothetical protein L2B55_10650 [Solitalea lacus]